MGSGGKKKTVGYKYYMGLHMVICHGPVDALLAAYAGERQISGITAVYDGVQTVHHVYANSPNLFGGKKKEGGIQGHVDILFGGDTQPQNDYLLAQGGITSSNLPAFRGVLSVVCRKIYIAAMSPYPKAWWFKVKRIPEKNWYAATASPRDGSANGAHILRETITNTDWGLGFSASTIENTSWQTAADTLYNEQLGLSLITAKQGSVKDFMKQILRHINGVIYTDRETGLFKLKLIRDDYDIGTVPVFNDSNILKLDSFQRPTYGEMINEVVIVFRKQGAFENSSLTFQDLASIQSQGGVISQTLQFPGIDHPDTAALIGSRELRQNSTPLAQIRITTNRDGWNINPGDVINFVWSPLGITQMAIRVLKVNYGEISNGRIIIDGIEDIFGLPDSSYIDAQASIWEDPETDPAAITVQRFEELTYWDLAVGSVDGGFIYADGYLDSTTSFLVSIAVQPTSSGPGFEVWTKMQSDPDTAYIERETGSYCGEGILSNVLDYTDTTDILLNSLPFDADEIEIGSWGYLNNEIIVFTAIDTDNNLISIKRGGIDTVPKRHAAGSRIWFCQDDWSLDLTEIVETDDLNIKLLSITGKAVLDINDSGITVGELTVTARQNKPYRPQNALIYDGVALTYSAYPDKVHKTIGVQFQNSNRLQQTLTDVPVFVDGNVTPESGTTYTVSFFGEAYLNKFENDTLAEKEYTGLTGASDISQLWSSELTDSNPVTYNPKPEPNFGAALVNDLSIGGPLSTQSVAVGSQDITFSEGRAVFNGTSSYIDLDNFAISSPWAFSLKVKPSEFASENASEYQLLIGKHYLGSPGGYALFGLYYHRPDNKLYYCYNSDTFAPVLNVSEQARLFPGVESHILVIVTGSVGAVYVNGVFNGNMTITGQTAANRPYVLGADWDQGEASRLNFFEGTISDVRFYSGTITGSDMWTTEARLNGKIMVKAKTVRTADSAESHQSFEYLATRIGWGLNFNLGWNGS